MKILLPVAWTVWGACLFTLLYWLYGLVSAPSDTLRSFGAFVLAVFVVAVLVAGGALYWASVRHSLFWVSAIAAVIALPFVFLFSIGVIGSATTAVKQRYDANEANKGGDFQDTKLQPIAAAIKAGNPTALQEAIAGQPIPKGTDRAGYDLLNYAIRRLRFDGGNLECVKLLLAAGADPNTLDPSTGWPPIMELGENPEAVRVLHSAGANIEALADGLSPVVRFTMLRQWDSAIYLVQRGARLDVQNEHGVSLDYYMKDWKDSVNNEHPEGWDRLRLAIQAERRSASSTKGAAK